MAAVAAPRVEVDEQALREFYARLQSDFLFYCPRALKVKDKGGNIRPLILNTAQSLIHDRLEEQKRKTGKVRALILKGRQMGCCYAPNHRVLTADYRWVRIADVEIGTRLMAVDEHAGAETTVSGRKSERRIRTAVVEAKAWLRDEAFELRMESGRTLVVTGQHRHLCQKRGGDDAQWRAVLDTRPGDRIRAMCGAPDEVPPDIEDGWFAGLLDGEGSFAATPQVRVALTQCDGAVLDRAKAYLRSRGINFYELVDERKKGERSKLGNKPVHCLRIDRHTDIIRLLCRTRPTRFVGRELFVGRKLPKTCDGFGAWDRVMSIRPVGLREVVDLQTSEQTFICDGLVSHNSTYIDARHFHRVSTYPGLKAVILTHLQDATDNLFAMASRYYENLPEALKIPLLAANAKELRFGAKMDSGYSVATAGSKAVGRSHTAQLFHGSEVAFWPNAKEHMAGIGQIIPAEPGTEIILESTANGYDPMFYPMWEAASRGLSDYQAIFTPWFMDAGYRMSPPRGFEFTSEDREYQQLHQIDEAQLYWRRRKIDDDLMGDILLFQQEYPATAAEAFVAFTDSLIPAINVLRARKVMPGRYEAIGPKIVGLDPARYGDDSTAWVERTGRIVAKAERYHGLSTMETANIVMRRINDEHLDAVFIDIVGLGVGVYDRCVEAGYGHVVRAVNGAERSSQPERHFNKRAECWAGMKDWFENGAQIPDMDDFQADILAPKYTYEGGNRLKIESKDQMRGRGIPSPDLADALAMTFAEPVFPLDRTSADERERIHHDKSRRGGWRVN